MVTQQRDHLWKTAFHLWIEDFVKFFFPDKYDEVDWTKKVVFLDKELNSLQIDSRPKDRIADVLVMLHLKSGKRLFLLLHIEIQGYFDNEYAYRVHQMSYRIEDKFEANPVMLTILTDDDPNFHPKEYYEETWGSGHRTFFNSYKVMKNPPSKYKDFDSPVALIMETVYASTKIKKRANDGGIMRSFIPIIRKLLSKNYEKEHIRFILSFIQGHIKFGDSEYYGKFVDKIDKMVKFQTTAEIAAYCLDPERQKKDLEKQNQGLEKQNQGLEKQNQGLQEDLTKAKQEKERERQEKDRERQEKELALERGVLGMLVKNIDREFIIQVFDITLEDIDSIQDKYKDEKHLEILLNGLTKK